jgi:hypothetical protein
MGCNCGKKKERKMYYPPTETEEAKVVEEPIEKDTVEKFHAREMDAYAKKIAEDTVDWFDNIDVIKPLDDE